MLHLHTGRLINNRAFRVGYNGLIVETLKLPSLRLDGTIIDIETSSLYPDEGEIICFGYISGPNLKSITRTSSYPYDQFLKLIREEVSKLRDPFYAYNKNFEQMWLDYIGVPLAWRDLMKPLRNNSELLRDKVNVRVKWSKLYEAFPLKFLRHFGVRDYNVNNDDISELWEEHLATESLEPLYIITQHNTLDLLTELSVLLWTPTLERLSQTLESKERGYIMERFSFRCDVCKREIKDSTELVYTHRVERKADGSFRVIELNVCKDCFEKIFK